MMPDLSILSDFVRIVHQWGLTGAPPENLLNATLPIFMKAVPEVQSLHLHSISHNKLQLIAATDIYLDGDAETLSIDELQEQAISTRGPVKSDDHTRWVVALHSGRQLHYLLEIITNPDQPSTESAKEWLTFVSAHLAHELARHVIQNLLRRQTTLFNQLVPGLSLNDMVRLISRYMMPYRGRLLAIIEVLYDDDNEITGWKPVISANRDKLIQPVDLTIGWDGVGPMVHNMMYEFEPIIVSDLEQISVDDMGEALWQFLAQQGTQSFLSVPVIDDGRVVNTLSVMSRDKYAFSPEEVDIFQSVAVLLGSLTRIRTLSNESEITHNVVENLVLGNRLVTTATSTAYMAQAVIYTLTQEIIAVLITRFGRVLSPGDQPSVQFVEAMSTSIAVHEFNDLTTSHQFTEKELDRLRAGLPIVIDDAQVIKNALPAGEEAIFGEVDFQWASVFGLRSGEQLLGTMVLLHNTSQSFSEAEISAYTTLADQIGVVMRSRQLLNDAQQAHERAVQLVHTNRAISAAKDYDEMSQVILHTLPPEVGAIVIALPKDVSILGELGEKIKVEVLRTRDEVFHPEPVDVVDVRHAGYTSMYNNIIAGRAIRIADTRTFDPVLKVIVNSLSEQGYHNLVMSGLLTGTGILGLLVLGIEEGVELDSVWTAHITSVADQMAATIENRRLLYQTNDALGFVHAQFETTSTLYRASNPAHMLYAIHKLAVFSGGEFNYAYIATPHSEDLAKMHILAEYNGDSLETISRYMDFEEYVGYNLLKDGKAVVCLDVLMDSQVLSEAEREKLQAQGVRSIMILPMVDTKQAIRGIVYLTAADLIEINSDQQRALISTVGQAAIVLENRDLFRRMEDSLYEARVLHNLSRDLLHAENMHDIQQVIFTHAALDSDMVMGLTVKYIDEQVVDVMVNSLVGLMGTEEVNTSLASIIALDVLKTYVSNWSDEPSVKFYESVKDSLLNIYFDQQNIISAIKVPTFVEERLSGVIIIGYQEARKFDKSLQRLYGVINDQVNIVLENQHLLMATESNLRETRVLYGVNRDLLTADDGLSIAHILYSHIVDKAASLHLLRVNWDFVNDEIVELLIEHRVSAGTVNSPNSPVLAVLPADVQDTIKTQLRNDDDVLFIEDTQASIRLQPLLNSVLDEDTTKSAIVLPVWDNDSIVNLIIIGLSEPHLFTGADRRLYYAVRDQVAVVLQNHRLLRDAQRAAVNLGSQVRVLQTINHLAATLSVTRDEQSLMDVTVESLHNSLDVDHVGIVMLNEDKETLTLVSEYPDTGAAGAIFSMDDPFQQRLSQSYDPIIIRSVKDATELNDSMKRGILDLGVSTLAFFPLQDPNYGYIGSVSLDLSDPQRVFDDNMINISRTITSQVTVTLQNIRLLESTQHQARQMELVAGFSQAIQTTLDVPTLLEIGMGNAQAIITSSHMAIMLMDNGTRKLRTVAWHDGDERPQVSMSGGPAVKLKGTTAGMVWRTHSPLQFDDLFDRDDLEYTFNASMRSVLSMPVYSRGVVTGIVELASEKPGFFTPTDFAVFQQLVSQLATAIENAEVYTQSQRLAQSKMQVNDISTHLQQNMDIDRLLDVTMSELGKALGAKRARIRLGLKDEGGKQ